MFNLFNRKPNYQKIFSSATETYKYIYGDRTKTVAILGDESFLEAWLSSEHEHAVTEVIMQEALRDDLPSLKELIWYYHMQYIKADAHPRNDLQVRIKASALKVRIELCEKAIELGHKETSYYAMVSCYNLYKLFEKAPDDSESGAVARTALSGAIRHANAFLETRPDDSGLAEDARNILSSYSTIVRTMEHVNQPQPLDSEDDIKALINSQGPAKAGEAIRMAADGGNLICQIFMSQLGLNLPAHMRTSSTVRDAEHYTTLAAQNGDPVAQFNLALIHMKRVNPSNGNWSREDVKNFEDAKRWLRKAAAQGFQDAIKNLKELED